jgi:hypothetical protein
VRPERQGQSATDREEQWHDKHDHNSRSHPNLIGSTERQLYMPFSYVAARAFSGSFLARSLIFHP